MVATRAETLATLPRPLTSLIGREEELEHLYSLLQSDAALVTITGFGGMGKTRLSLQAALELEPIFDAGALFASLASVTKGSSIPKAIAITAELDESVDSVDSLAEALGPHTRLLVLDNLEQIPDASQVVWQLLQAMPNVTVLATSRSRLNLGGEYVLSLEPLQTESSDPRSLSAVQLLIERGLAVAPSLPTDDDAIAVVAEICQKLEGIPLAIELAAARLAIFSLPTLRDQLQTLLPVLASNRVDMPDRQRTMRDAIAWTYDLLEESARRLFTWLSVYEQDFSLDSIRHATAQLELTAEPIDLVQFLVSHNLIRPSRRGSDSPRFQMPQMLREFGHEMLLQFGQDDIARHSHALDMVRLSEKVEPLLTTTEQGQISQQIDLDLPNILAALIWSKRQNYPELGQRIIGGLWRYFENAGHSRRVLEIIPDTGEGTAPDEIRAKALVGIGYMYEKLRELAPSLQTFNQAVEVASSLPDQVQHVRALLGLGTVQFDYSDVPLAQETLRRAGKLATRIGFQHGQIISEGQLSVIDLQLGNYKQAIAINGRLIRLVEEEGDMISAATLYLNTGTCFLNLDQFEEAQDYYLKALDLAEQAEDLSGAAVIYANLSGIYLRLDDLEKAAEYGEKGLDLSRQSGQRNAETGVLSNLAGIKIRQKDFGATMEMMAQASRIMDFDGGTKEQAHFASVACEIAMEVGLKLEAAEMLGAVISMRESLQIMNRETRDDFEDEALATLDPQNNPDISAAMERGAQLDRTGIVNRMQELNAMVASIEPPKSDLPAAPVQTPEYDLTPREIEVMQMVAKGFTNSEIADEMFVSVRTITTHLSNIFGKLEVGNRSKAVAAATQAGLV